MKIAFSTLACPDMPLDRVVSLASRCGYLGVDMRSFTDEGERMANDPMSLDPAQVDSIFDDAGIIPLCLSTSVRYDAPIDPPVIGRVWVNEEAGVPETKSFVDMADRAGVKFVRVFGYQLPAAEPRTWSMRRVVERLTLAAQTCRNTDVRLLVENAGSFSQAEALRELIERVNSQWLGASYNIQAAVNAGECPLHAVETLGDTLKVVRVMDADDDGNPVELGKGVYPLEKFFTKLRDIGFDGWVVYEYPKRWYPELGGECERVLQDGADLMYRWMAQPAHA
ncbi:MAG: sugar phosphate isomerase/epimerase family protein [Phycisphaerales bacterium]